MEILDQKLLLDMLYTNPVSLLAIKNEQVINEINNLIPYSTGFEIECDEGSNYNEQTFRIIPDIMDVQNDSWEQRYRIPNGLRGIICLYNISIQLKLNSLLNPKSSIHYHVDCTDCFNEISRLINQKNSKEYILCELDTWLEKSNDASNRTAGCWFKLNDLKTIEFRLGEMTFEYPILLKRIIHCNSIVKKFKDQLSDIKAPEYIAPDFNRILEYTKTVDFGDNNKINNLNIKLAVLQKELEEKDKKEIKTEEQIIIKKRIHRI